MGTASCFCLVAVISVISRVICTNTTGNGQTSSTLSSLGPGEEHNESVASVQLEEVDQTTSIAVSSTTHLQKNINQEANYMEGTGIESSAILDTSLLKEKHEIKSDNIFIESTSEATEDGEEHVQIEDASQHVLSNKSENTSSKPTNDEEYVQTTLATGNVSSFVIESTSKPSIEIPLAQENVMSKIITSTSNLSTEGKGSEEVGKISTTESQINLKAINIEVKTNSSFQNLTTSESKAPLPDQPDEYEPIKVLVAQKKYFSILNVPDREAYRGIIESDNTTFYSVDYIYNRSLIFFSAYDSIYRATFDGNSDVPNIEEIVDTEVDGPVRLAVDWIHGRLYWMADRYQTVMTSDLDGNDVTPLIDNVTMNFKFPNNIVVDPFEGLIFFVNDHVIYKASLNGSGVEYVKLAGIDPGKEDRGVKTIALDRINKKIYFFGRQNNWSNNKHPYYLAYVDYDGFDEVEDIEMSELNYIYSMDILGDTLYFANYMKSGYNKTSCPDTIMSTPTNISETPSIQTLFVPRHCTDGIWNMKVFHPCAQKLSCEIEE